MEDRQMMKKINILFYTFLTIIVLTVFSCNRYKSAITRTDTPTSGVARIAGDECLEPVIREEIAVFTSLNLDAQIFPVFTSEQEIFNLLLSDSLRVVVAARDITELEIKHLKSLKRFPRSQKIATDGVALIINKDNKDSLLSIFDLKKIITGEISNWAHFNTSLSEKRPITVVFDQQNSSTLRFITDSITMGLKMGEHCVAAKSNLEVINYVAKQPNALGIIGVNWISNPKDSTSLSFDNSIRVVSLSREIIPTKEDSYKPFPAYLATGDYPLQRDIYVIISDVMGGLPSGFVSFMAGDSGQRIILKAGLVPATRPTRLVNLKNDF
jgi:phosphate transport system substrate-binding protein